MRVVASAVLLAATIACGCGGLFTQYEYEEEMYLSLDGTATLYVNASVPALNVLRGTTFDPRPDSRVDRSAVSAFFASPVARVTRVTTSRRQNRNFVHVRLDVDDVTRLSSSAPFSWSAYSLDREGDLMVYRQVVGDPSIGDATGAFEKARWIGEELVAFRVHIPSRVVYHNAGADNLRRGNILVWEQTLDDRMRGTPVTIDARMETQSILYRTLWLFGATVLVVALMFAVIVWRVRSRGEHHRREEPGV